MAEMPNKALAIELTDLVAVERAVRKLQREHAEVGVVDGGEAGRPGRRVLGDHGESWSVEDLAQRRDDEMTGRAVFFDHRNQAFGKRGFHPLEPSNVRLPRCRPSAHRVASRGGSAPGRHDDGPTRPSAIRAATASASGRA